MSVFDQTFSAVGAPELFAQLGRAATFIRQDGEQVEITAIIGPVRQNLEESSRNEREQIRRREVKVITDETSPLGGVADPQENETIEFDSEVWSITSVDTTGSVATLQVVFDELVDRQARNTWQK